MFYFKYLNVLLAIIKKYVIIYWDIEVHLSTKEKNMNINEAKILICDDSTLARRQVKDVVGMIGTPTFFEAEDGEVAVNIVREEKPDMIFLDLIMPNMDGTEALTQIMEIDKDAKVVIVSSIGTQDVLIQTLKLGAREFIQKPFSEMQILNALNKCLQ